MKCLPKSGSLSDKVKKAGLAKDAVLSLMAQRAHLQREVLALRFRLAGSSPMPRIPAPRIPVAEAEMRLPPGPGIYFGWRKGIIQYIGQSVNLRQRCRISSHPKLAVCEYVSWLMCAKSMLQWWECYYIGLMCPPLNATSQTQQAMKDESALSWVPGAWR